MSVGERVERAANFLEGWLTARPEVAIVLGSGLKGLAKEVHQPAVVPYTEIPGFPVRVIPGQAGELVVGCLGGKEVGVLSGRAHYYQGYSPAEVAIGVRVMARMGARILMVTNAAGALDASFQPGELMLIGDHIDLPGLAGHHVLREELGKDLASGFLAMAQAYDEELRALARRVAEERGILLREGVYVMVSGPSYETPAEVAFLRAIGAQAVGMSTVPEVIAARQEGLRVLAVSYIANLAGGSVSQQEVLRAGERAEGDLARLIVGVLEAL